MTVSVNTETEGSKSDAECRGTYRCKQQTNPMLVKGSGTVFETDAASLTIYRSEGVFKGWPFKTANANVYVAGNRICADIHVSHWPYSEEHESIVAGIVTSGVLK